MLKIGMVGLDSTHAVEFTRLLNAGPIGQTHRAAHVVAACPGDDTDFPLSVNRRRQVLSQVKDLGVPVLDSVAELLARVDAVMLLSCDGRRHRHEAERLLASRKPLFIDKPLCADWREAVDLLRVARLQRTPCFSASALRFRPRRISLPTPITTLRVEASVPALQEPGHPALCWHGIHGIEAGYALLGAGCCFVRRTVDDHGDVTIGRWPNGAELHVQRRSDEHAGAFPVRILSPQRTDKLSGVTYRPLLQAMLAFFTTGAAPVSGAEMIEVLAFAAAADESHAHGGTEIDFRAYLAKGGVDL